jgi:ABC-2 type transport system permease protein
MSAVTSPSFSVARIAAMVKRHWYLLRSSWPRLLELIYWPLVQMVMWGFLQSFMAKQTGALAMAAGTFLAAVLLWDILFRGQLGFSFSFLEEMWSRNLANLMISPLRPIEFALSMITMSLIRLTIGIVPVTFLAILFFGFNFWGLGIALAAFFVNLLLTSWAIGLLCAGLVLRNGLGAEGLTWSIMFLFLPLTCVYYPVATLPVWLQAISWALPPTAVFEGMRALVLENTFRADLMLWAFAINIVWITLAGWGFLKLMHSSKQAGSLMSVGE